MFRKTTLYCALISVAQHFTGDALAEGAKKPAPAQDIAVCAQVTVSAPYAGYGYTHLVTLNNTCSKSVICEVWTDVDPAHVPLSAKAGQSESVATRRGSPSSEVRVQSSCKFES